MKRREFGQGLAAGALFASPWLGSSASAAAEPAVTGPVNGGRHGRPFDAYLGDIGALGYTEEEFFLSGTGTQYKPARELNPDGRWTVSPAGSVPFKTRMLVRRPRDPKRFNGVVVVEWLNVTAGHDIGLLGHVSDGIYRDGFAFVMVSCQRVGLEGFSNNPQGLRAWDPERYGSLSLPGDSISYDILSQAGRAVGAKRPRDGVDPLRGLNVRKIIATGGSQSAGRLRTYINAVHPRDRVFDGFLPVIDFGMGMGFDDSVLDPRAGGPPASRVFIRSRIREDIDVPVFVVNSETETLLYHPSRQPDARNFRFWEVAGASHAPEQMDHYLAKLRERDGLTAERLPTGSKVMWQPTADAALSHLATWITKAAEPPKAELIEVKDGRPLEVVRDEFGNAKGGVRLPELEAPVAHYRAAMQTLSGTGGLRGETVPFARDVLKRLYPNRDVYVSRVAAAARAAGAAGVIESTRVAQYIADAKTTPIGD